MTDPGHTLRDLLQKIEQYKNRDIKIKPISSEGANFTTQLFLATVSAEGEQDLKLFAKVAVIGEKVREITPFKIYEAECFFYTDLLKRFREFEDTNNLAEEHRLVAPKFYACSEEYLKEVLVLEDLTDRGFKMFDRFSTVTWEYAATAFEQLAIFHALSMMYGIKYPKEFKKLVEKFQARLNPENMQEYLKNMLASTMEVVKDEYKARFKKFVDEKLTDINVFDLYCNPLRRPVIVHGDFRQSNLMHLEKQNELQIIILDYQTIQMGNCITDLLYFIFNGTDEQFRAKYYQKLLDHYYTKLSQALMRLGLNPDDIYSRDDFEFELKNVLPFGLCISLFTLPLVTVDTENAPVIKEDSEIMDFLIKPNALFKERFNGILSDYAKMDVI